MAETEVREPQVQVAAVAAGLAQVLRLVELAGLLGQVSPQLEVRTTFQEQAVAAVAIPQAQRALEVPMSLVVAAWLAPAMAPGQAVEAAIFRLATLGA